jgi:hypothetical protein
MFRSICSFTKRFQLIAGDCIGKDVVWETVSRKESFFTNCQELKNFFLLGLEILKGMGLAMAFKEDELRILLSRSSFHLDVTLRGIDRVKCGNKGARFDINPFFDY